MNCYFICTCYFSTWIASTTFSNASLFSRFTVITKRDCDSANNAAVASPSNFTVAPKPLAPIALSEIATAKPPSATSCAD